jgi:hypothetical protein
MLGKVQTYDFCIIGEKFIRFAGQKCREKHKNLSVNHKIFKKFTAFNNNISTSLNHNRSRKKGSVNNSCEFRSGNELEQSEKKLSYLS